MIYVLQSSAYGDSGNYIDIIKIGYTKDQERRKNAYYLSNPTIKLLYLFKDKGSTEKVESQLHEYFSEFRYEKYGREWFYKTDEILNFFSGHTFSEILKIVGKIKKEKVRKEPKTIQSIYRVNEDKISKESKLIFTNLLNLKNYEERLKYILNSENINKEVLELLPESYTMAVSLGLERCRANGYKFLEIKKELEIVTYNTDNLDSKVLSSFEIGKRYSFSSIKESLKDIYSLFGYKKSPKANDLEKWFEVKKVYFLDSNINKKTNGFEIIKRKD